MKRWDTVAIVGVGLIGGSIGLALQRGNLARRIIGVGRRTSSLRKAKQHGAVSSTTTDLARGVKEADLVIVCTPVSQIVEHVLTAAEHCPSGALITDVGSTKHSIVAALETSMSKKGISDQATFVGSHPLAGSEKTGPQHAREDLFDQRVTVITPTRKTASEDVNQIEQFWQSLGSKVIRTTPQAHDAALADSSHLPHLVASVLAAATPEKHLPFAATGWLDTTRIAAADVELWKQIFSENQDHVLKSLAKFEKLLASFREALKNNNQKKITQILETGKQHRDSVGN